MTKINLIKEMFAKKTEKIIDDMYKNREKIKPINSLMKETSFKDIDEQKFELMRNYIIWANKELLVMYDNYETILGKSKEELHKIN